MYSLLEQTDLGLHYDQVYIRSVLEARVNMVLVIIINSLSGLVSSADNLCSARPNERFYNDPNMG